MDTKQTKGAPNDHHGWTVQILNIHGAVFERWVEYAVEKAGPPWTLVASQFPVEYPPPHGATRGHETTLDVWADYRLDRKWLSLLVDPRRTILDLWIGFFFEPEAKKEGLFLSPASTFGRVLGVLPLSRQFA
jgi:hypothetical protein